jgi:hypothetical protein
MLRNSHERFGAKMSRTRLSGTPAILIFYANLRNHLPGFPDSEFMSTFKRPGNVKIFRIFLYLPEPLKDPVRLIGNRRFWALLDTPPST